MAIARTKALAEPVKTYSALAALSIEYTDPNPLKTIQYSRDKFIILCLFSFVKSFLNRLEDTHTPNQVPNRITGNKMIDDGNLKTSSIVSAPMVMPIKKTDNK